MALIKFLTFGAGNPDDPTEVRDVRLSCYKECKVAKESEEIVLYEIPEPPERDNRPKDDKENAMVSCGAGLLTNIRDNNNRDEKKDITKPLKYDLIVKNTRAKDYGLRGFRRAETVRDDMKLPPVGWKAIYSHPGNLLLFNISLRRFSSLDEALNIFDQFHEKIALLVKAMDSFPGRDLMGKWFMSAIEHPSWTVAHLAAAHSQLDVLKHQLIAKFLNERCSLGKTPIAMAVEALNAPVVQLLIDQGARVDIVDNDKNTPFHYAVRLENKSLLEMICRAQGASAGMNQKNNKDQSPLQAACTAGLSSFVEHLLRQGVDVNSASFGVERQKSIMRQAGEREMGLYSERLMRKGGTPLHWVKTRASLEAMIDIGCDLNAKNCSGDTALHVVAAKRRLDSLIWLLIEGADVNAKNNDGDTPLIAAVKSSNPQQPQDAWMLFKQKAELKKAYVWSNTHDQKHEALTIVQMLLAFGADANILNSRGETARHLAAVIASDIHNPRCDQLLFALHAVGAKRCVLELPECKDGCKPSGTFDGVPPSDYGKDTNKIFDGPLSETVLKKGLERKRQREKLGKDKRKKRCRALAVDGGGVKGLVSLRAMKCLEEAVGSPIMELFDWVMGTSAGGISTLCLASGHNLESVFRTAFRLKEKFIFGPRPYDTDGLEEFLKRELGDEAKFCDIAKPRIAVTACNAESWPTKLKLFRNYVSPRSLLVGTPEPPDDERLWSAARATGAAPTFFRPYKKYLDGAVMSNNPTLDLMTEITEYNASMEGRPTEQFDVDIIVSVGGGMRPTSPVSTIEALQLDPGLFGAARVAYSVGHLIKFCVEQIAEPDGRHVDRARAWCYGLGVPYARLQPLLSQYIAVNESDNKVIAKILWETMAYFHQHSDELQVIAELLRDEKKS